MGAVLIAVGFATFAIGWLVLLDAGPPGLPLLLGGILLMPLGVWGVLHRSPE